MIYDPLTDRWVLATDAVTNTGSGLLYDIMVTTSGNPFGFWNTPVHIPGMPLAPSNAHGPQVLVDPATGDYGVLFTQSFNDGTSRPMVSYSTDGGVNWTTPNPIAEAGSHFDFVAGGLGPDGRLNTVFGDFSQAGTYDLLFNSAPFDPTVTWPSPITIASGLPRSGTAGQCGNNGSLRSLFGQIAALDAPSIAVDPTEPSGNTMFVATSRLGAAGDESDVAVFRSTNGGLGWIPLGQTGSEPARAEFAPEVTVSPDGRVAIAQLLADLRNLQDLQVSVEVRFLTVEDQFFERIGVDFDLGTPVPVSEAPFDAWRTNPSFDSNYSDCFGLTPIGATSPGSGFFVAWADGRDPGPVENNGIDPNIYFASTEGVPFPTEQSGLVTKTSTKLKVTGDVSPKPAPGARVILTLLRKQGGTFEQIGRKRPRTDRKGEWKAAFKRPEGGKCRVLVEFTGAEGRAPSVPISATFTC